MNILHFVPVYAPAWSYGGPVRSISMLAEEQARQGHRVAVLTTNAGMFPADGIQADEWGVRNGVEVRYCTRARGFGIKSPALEHEVGQRVREFDVLHLSAIWHPVARAAHAAAYRHGIPVVISPRGALGPYAWRRRRWLKVVYYLLFERVHFQRAAGFHFTSQKEATESMRYAFGRPHRIVPNGIDEHRWRHDESAGHAWRMAHEIREDERLLLYVGRLHHKKGLDVLPEAIASAQQASPAQRLRLMLVGPNEDGTLQRLQQLSARYLPADAMIWISTLPEQQLPAVYSAADAFVMPSLHENFGNSAIEALACGSRTIVSSETGCLEFGAGCGMEAVRQPSVAAWAAAIVQTLRAEPRSIGAEDRRRLMARVGLPPTAASMVEFYRGLVATGKVRT